MKVITEAHHAPSSPPSLCTSTRATRDSRGRRRLLDHQPSASELIGPKGFDATGRLAASRVGDCGALVEELVGQVEALLLSSTGPPAHRRASVSPSRQKSGHDAPGKLGVVPSGPAVDRWAGRCFH